MGFSEEEISCALSELTPFKSWDLDNSTTTFWQCYQDSASGDFGFFFKEFHEQDCFMRSLNATFLVLIEDIEGFRPLV